MELDMFEVLLRHGKNVSRVGQEHVSSVLVLGHVLIFTLLEAVKLSGIVALYPACFVQMYGFPATLSVIFILQSVLNDLKLQLSYGAYYAASVELVDEELRHAFVHQLLQSFLELLRLHRVVILYVFEHLR